MKKIITAAALGVFLLVGAAPAFAESTSTVSTSTPAINLPCMQAAIQKRANAVTPAEDAFWTATRAAMQTRLSAVIAAWGITDQTARQTALKAANQAYRDALKPAREARQATVKSAGEQWKTDVAACGVSSSTNAFGKHGIFRGMNWGKMFGHRGF